MQGGQAAAAPATGTVISLPSSESHSTCTAVPALAVGGWAGSKGGVHGWAPVGRKDGEDGGWGMAERTRGAHRC